MRSEARAIKSHGRGSGGGQCSQIDRDDGAKDDGKGNMLDLGTFYYLGFNDLFDNWYAETGVAHRGLRVRGSGLVYNTVRAESMLRCRFRKLQDSDRRFKRRPLELSSGNCSCH